MRIGAFTQGYVRADSTPQRRISEVVVEAIAAEEAGLASFGVSEQHFRFPTNSTGPIDSIMAAVAQATERIDIMPGTVILPLHHPLHTAERWAAIDIISNGRVYFGVGKGNNPRTIDVFGVSSDHAEAMTREALQIIVNAWTQESFAFDGEFWQFQEIGLCPRPVQQPHPPIAWSGLTPDTARVAGEMQVGLMAGALANDWATVETVIDTYRENWKTGTPLDNATPSKKINMLINGHIGNSFDEVKEQVEDGLMNYVRRIVTFKRELLARNGTPDPDYGSEFLDNFEAAVSKTPSLYGTPDAALEVLQQFKALGVDQVDVTFDYATHEDMVKSIGLLGELAKEVAEEPLTAAVA
ncbi:MAG: LLM class flavin-dependent oxidoreductase [Candidatus Leucobacter sulfamidivorax]|nr:LLM class flavin-dependent oxidoreductase [Candidatus Leucobacter sulfamidivorax]